MQNAHTNVLTHTHARSDEAATGFGALLEAFTEDSSNITYFKAVKAARMEGRETTNYVCPLLGQPTAAPGPMLTHIHTQGVRERVRAAESKKKKKKKKSLAGTHNR